MVKYYHVVWSVPNYPTLKKKNVFGRRISSQYGSTYRWDHFQEPYRKAVRFFTEKKEKEKKKCNLKKKGLKDWSCSYTMPREVKQQNNKLISMRNTKNCISAKCLARNHFGLLSAKLTLEITYQQTGMLPTHFCSMFHFHTPWKRQKTMFFDVFKGYGKGTLC